LLLALAFALSPYFFAPSFILLTYNAAFGLWLLAVFLLVLGPRPALGSGAISLPLAGLVRQAVVWIAPALVLWTPTGWERPRPARWLRLLAMSLPAAALLPLFLCWKGLTPPRFQQANVHRGMNLEAVL